MATRRPLPTGAQDTILPHKILHSYRRTESARRSTSDPASRNAPTPYT